MSHFYLLFTIALRYIYFSKQHKYAKAIALIATFGIVIGISALIIVTSIMQGLEKRLQDGLFVNNYHALIYADEKFLNSLLEQDLIYAYVPFIEGEAMLQTQDSLYPIKLYGIKNNAFVLKDQSYSHLINHYDFLHKNSFNLDIDSYIFFNDNLKIGSKVKLISLQNARYTAMGITPLQRNFYIVSYSQTTATHKDLKASGYYDDIKKLLRNNQTSYRVYVNDPNNMQNLIKALNGVKYKLWTDNLGEFFKAVAMERLTMSIMLCLIIVVAAFNILSAIAMMVSARLNDIAILKTQGFCNKDILFIFVIMGLICSSLGAILGSALGIVLALNTNTILSALNLSISVVGTIPIAIDLINISYICLATIGITCICALYPAYKASRAQIVQNLVKVN